MESSSQDRNLPASQQKLDKARGDGQVARSRYLGHLAVLGTGALSIVAFALAIQLLDHLAQHRPARGFVIGRAEVFPGLLGHVIGEF